MKKRIYLVLTIVGFILPYALFLPWIFEEGLDIPLFFQNLFANKISGAFGLDVLVSAVVVVVFILSEGKELAMNKLWIPIAGTILVGVSFGFPLFLYMKEKINNDKKSFIP